MLPNKRVTDVFLFRGVVLGLVSALLASLAESPYLLRTRTYVPSEFPLVLVAVNAALWTGLGLLSGGLLRRVCRYRGKPPTNRGWVLCFLAPFAIFYGLLGRIHFPPIPLTFARPGPVFDYHLSFVWAVFVLWLCWRFVARRQASPLLFIPEQLTLLALFHFCSNLHRSPAAAVFRKLQGLGLTHQAGFNIGVYVVGVLALFGLYILCGIRWRSALGKFRLQHPLGVIGILLLPVGLMAGGSLWLQQRVADRLHTVHSAAANLEQSTPVILIVLDTLRADRMGLYNSAGARTPFLEAFSRDARVYDNCIAPSPWTLLSHASLFTGLYTTEHQCTGDLAETWPDVSPPFLADHFVTLAEIFQQAGYVTAAVAANYGWLHPQYNVHQGFQIYDRSPNIGIDYVKQPFRSPLHLLSYVTHIYPKSILSYRTADDINREAMSVIEKIGGRPFFLFMNYMDVHGPYRPPRPYDRMYLPQTFPQAYRLLQYYRFCHKTHQKEDWDAYLLSQYDGEITRLDHQLGRLMQYLQERDLYDASLIVITSDHGELFGEHGQYAHNYIMYEGVIKVPLLVKYPRSEKTGRVTALVNVTDVFSMLLAAVGLPDPLHSRERTAADGAPVVAEYFGYDIGEHRALFLGKYKFMNYALRDSMKRGKPHAPELYDLQNDPQELQNLYAAEPEVAARMQALLDDWLAAHPPQKKAKGQKVFDQESLEGLRALGYIQ